MYAHHMWYFAKKFPPSSQTFANNSRYFANSLRIVYEHVVNDVFLSVMSSLMSKFAN